MSFHSSSNAQAGPSREMVEQERATPVIVLSRRKSAVAKRKRTGDDGSGSSPPTRKGAAKPKAHRACGHCQKSHLTCDDSRPCMRCVKRGIADTCAEGRRKKAKYLLDEEELEKVKAGNTLPHVRTITPTPRVPTPPPPLPPQQQQPDMMSYQPQQQQEPNYAQAFDPSAFAFGSEQANLEYSILSSILGNPSPPESGPTPPPPPSGPYPQSTTWPSEPQQQQQSGAMSIPAQPVYPTNGTWAPPSDMNPQSFLGYPPPSSSYPHQQQTYDMGQLQYPGQFRHHHPPVVHPLAPRFPNDRGSPPLASPYTGYSNEAVSRALGGAAASAGSPPRSHDSPGARSDPSSTSQLQSINDRVTVPYDYTEGYHFLMKHLPGRFEKNDILRIVRALAIFRPSLIALQMPLSLDDEVFVEKCFQRSLLELEKLISFSGTPTVVWRRTGEICLVAPEFSLLTGWSSKELVGKGKYVYEMFENQSVVEYWENFASHAFENTTKSVYSHCVLLRPDGSPVPCTFCFSIRRDLFDLPSLVIGQWLPLL